MNVHVVYAHPYERSFTHAILMSFIKGLEESGHSYTVSDLYQMGFAAELSLGEYMRESSYKVDLPLMPDILAEQRKLNNADVWVFIYPVWWTDCPAILKGWFDRVWTVGFAYRPQSVHKAKKAIVICSAGHTLEHLKETGCYQAMETTMLADRIYDRAESKEFVVLGGSESYEDDRWLQLKQQHLEQAYQLGRLLQ